MRPFYRSSDFYLTVGVALAFVGVAVYSLTSSHPNNWEHVTAAVSLVLAYLKAHGYTSARMREELARLISSGQIAVPDPSITPVPPAPVPDSPSALPVPMPASQPPQPINVVIQPQAGVEAFTFTSTFTEGKKATVTLTRTLTKE
jgi:hypothetical protein